MKIIFDNESQKRTMLNLLAESSCPHDYDLRSSDSCTGSDDYRCMECWKNCELEMEIKDEQ